MKTSEKADYWQSHLEALRKCQSYMQNSLKLIEYEIISCQKEIQFHNGKPDIQVIAPYIRPPTSEERIAFLEAANYQPEY